METPQKGRREEPQEDAWASPSYERVSSSALLSGSKNVRRSDAEMDSLTKNFKRYLKAS